MKKIFYNLFSIVAFADPQNSSSDQGFSTRDVDVRQLRRPPLAGQKSSGGGGKTPIAGNK